MGDALYYAPLFVDDYLAKLSGDFAPPRVRGVQRLQLAAMLLMFGRGGNAVSWAKKVPGLSSHLHSALPDADPLPWHRLPLGVKQWAAAGLPGLCDLRHSDVYTLVGIMCEGCCFTAAAQLCFRLVLCIG